MVVDDSLSLSENGVIRKYYWLALVICCGIIGLAVLSQISASHVWDDAYMFVRYADNVLTYKNMAWNPGGEPTYGLTSILYLAVVLPLRLVVPDNPALAAVLSSLVSGCLFSGLLVILLERYTAATPKVRRILVVFILFALAASSENLAAHFVGGMDTTFALAFVTTYILLSKWHESSLSTTSMVLVGIWGGLAFYARPDLTLYSFIVPASMAVWGPERRAKQRGLASLGITVGVTGALVWLAYRHLNSPLPLPFYSKGLGLYGESTAAQYRFVPARELFFYLLSYWYLFLLIGANLLINFKEWRRRTSAVDKGLLIATGLFIFYYLFFVLQIMYYHQRFYYPTLPAIAFLASQSAARMLERGSRSIQQEFQRSSSLLWPLAALFLLVSLLAAFLSIPRNFSEPSKTDLAHFTVLDSYKSKWRDYWFRLDEFSELPNDLVIAATEVGHLAAMNPEKVIVDLSGLNETDFAHQRFSADLLFRKYQPDLIYMPHPNYNQMIDQIADNQYFSNHYDYFSAQELNVAMGLALRRDSKYYPAMLEIVENGGRP